MPSPFPGMDPWLENPVHWAGFHLNLIAEILRTLNQRLRPKYVAVAEERVYISDDDDPGYVSHAVPDVRISRSNRRNVPKPSRSDLEATEPLVVTMLDDEEVHEPYIQILDAVSREVVSVVEVLSPANKIAGSRGRDSFRAKRSQVLKSHSHWVEIDLLRGGIRPKGLHPEAPSDYRVLVSRAGERPKTSVWPIDLRDPLPRISVPLKRPDPDVILDLQAIVTAVYDSGAFDLVLDYTAAPPSPRLRKADLNWAIRLLAQRRAG